MQRAESTVLRAVPWRRCGVSRRASPWAAARQSALTRAADRNTCVRPARPCLGQPRRPRSTRGAETKLYVAKADRQPRDGTARPPQHHSEPCRLDAGPLGRRGPARSARRRDRNGLLAYDVSGRYGQRSAAGSGLASTCREMTNKICHPPNATPCVTRPHPWLGGRSRMRDVDDVVICAVMRLGLTM